MKRRSCSAVLVLTCLVVASSSFGQTWNWAIKPIGLAGTNFDDNKVVSVALDHLDNSYIVGTLNDSGTFSAQKMKSLGGTDPFIAKLNSTGQLEWFRMMGGLENGDQAIDVTVDAAGNAYAVVYFVDSILIGGSWVEWGLNSFTGLAKYDPNGNVVWARAAAGLSIATLGGVEYSPSDHIYLAVGHTLAKYTLNGDTVWTRQVPILSASLMYEDIAVDKFGAFVYVTGNFSGSIDFGGITLNTGNLSNWDIFVAKYDSDGNLMWAKQAGGSKSIFPDAGHGIEVDGTGSVYVCGQFTDSAAFETDTFPSNSPLYSMFLAKYASTGDLDWVMPGVSNGGASFSSGVEVRLVSNESAVLVAATFGSAVTFGGTAFTITGGDALLAKVSSNGALAWGKQSGSTLAIITVNGMDVNHNTSSAVLVGQHSNLSATFTPFVFINPTTGAADGFIVGASTDSPTPVEEREGATLPTTIALAQNYPNPFNPVTTIAYDLSTNAHVILAVYNLLGQKVRTLVDQEAMAGAYQVDWDGRADDGSQLATGVYLYRLQTGEYTESKKMIMLK